MKKVALYIHIPFCKQKCLYCDFPSYSHKEELMDEYVKALNKEILSKTKKYKIESLFIGGGTPSYLSDENLKILLDTINKLDFVENAEKTMECNPGTVNKEKLEIIFNGGINRISFGLQSTNNEILKKIGRIHTYEEFKENYILARKIGFKNINIDMMFGLPNQSLNIWLESLKEVVELNPEHISSYSLIIEEKTPFYSLFNKDLLDLPSEEEERAMYEKGRDFLEFKGYNQYEISNYAKDNKECFHNKIYWQCKEYIGVGVSSSSYIDGKRIKNIDNIKEYIKNINENNSIIDEELENTEKDKIEEFMFMGLRMIKGIEEKEFENRFGKKIDELYKEVIEKHIKNGLLIREDGRIFLSKKGIELSNMVMSDMILE
ncbi:MAG: radical SAM family heme chaperone HemW [Clostridium sp.]|nr:radical SAM family heme chaperone HemW [Clostridium sp.]MCI7443706.1 radical SAM family heme chaperone HemW [Clostridium sp.]